MGGARRNHYYGFELYGESFEGWSQEDLIDDTQIERIGEKDWYEYHNSGCYVIGG